MLTFRIPDWMSGEIPGAQNYYKSFNITSQTENIHRLNKEYLHSSFAGSFDLVVVFLSAVWAGT